MHPLLARNAASIAALCRRYGVRRLDVFGSAARGDFDEQTSDVDLVVEFGPGPGPRTLEQYVGLKSDLESLLGKPVDLVELEAMPATRLKRLIEQARMPLYAASA
jgi:predicted nucleotidyltransferase